MTAKDVIVTLERFRPPEGWSGHLFLLPKDAMVDLHDFIVAHQLHSCIELGTGFGATSCVMATALQTIGGAPLVTVDKHLHEPVNVKVLMEHVGLVENSIQVVVDRLGYNWYLADLIRRQSHGNTCRPLFDFCLLDGAHEWETDALAFTLIAKLLKPGGWIAIDDINWNFAMMDWQASHGHLTPREVEAWQMKMVYDLIVRQCADFGNFRLTHNGRIGWARKKLLKSRGWFQFFQKS